MQHTAEPTQRVSDLRSRLLAEPEWLLTDGAGGFSMGTASGIPTRKYHAMLIASQSPPVDRVAMVQDMVFRLLPDRANSGRPIELSVFAFDSHGEPTLHPGDPERACRFEHGPLGGTVRWTWDLPKLGGSASRVLHLHQTEKDGVATVSVRFEWPVGVRAEVLPLISLRDMHHTGDHRALHEDPREGGVLLRRGHAYCDVSLREAASASFDPRPDWWRGFRYEHEADRGFDAVEDLFAPGAFCSDRGTMELIVRASDARDAQTPTIEASQRQRAMRLEPALDHATQGSRSTGAIAALTTAADAYVVRRGDEGVSIIAGYPWFSDWGRDSMIALPGLLLETGRYDEAFRVLKAFAENRNESGGLIPNRFADDGSGPMFNTADASLWFLHAACEYRRVSKDDDGFKASLLEPCFGILDGYVRGQPGDIGVDDDGLVMAGNDRTQLTWMDAEREGVVFTPRHGKPVELSALWYHGLRSVAEAIRETSSASGRAGELDAMADRTEASFKVMFFDESRGWCADCIGPDGPVFELRPNQLFAVSLRHSMLDVAQQKSLVDACVEALWTPCGVRTLSPDDAAYKPRYAGAIGSRDAAYHQGTAWPWLLGPMVEGVLRAGAFDGASKKRALSLIEPLLAEIREAGSGHVFEVYDAEGDAQSPQQPGGCPAQAWSVAELLRVLRLIEVSEQD